MKEEQERINKWEVKHKELVEELYFVNYWHRKNNLANLGLDKYLHESNFETLK
jgi:hypothetical protein